MSLILKTVYVVPNSRKSLLSALATISECDADFNGENGIEYMWDMVWKANGFENYETFIDANKKDLKYESNLDWLLEEVSSIKDDNECVKCFFDTWMQQYSGYYREWNKECVYNDLGDIIAIGFSAIC